MRSLFLFLIALPISVFAGPLDGPYKTHDSIVFLESGVICAPPASGESIAPNTIAGTTHIIEETPPFVSNNNLVPAVIGIGFGITAMTNVEGGQEGVTMTIFHPEMGPDRITVQSYQTRISGTQPSITFYQFDYDYELLHGDWQIEARIDDKILFRRSFTVLPPDRLPELASICGYEELLS